MRPATPVLSGIVLALALAACTGSSTSGGGAASVPATATGSSAAASPSPASTMASAAAPAVAAYEAAIDAASNAQRHPVAKGGKLAPDADFTKYTVDPFRSEYEIYIWGLEARGGQYRGTPPTSHVKVTSVDLTAKPYPVVKLSDCPGDDSRWRLYDTATGAVQPRATQKVSPPYRSSVTVILYKKHWGVQTVVLDSSRTCTP